MLNSSSDYKLNVYGSIREFEGKVDFTLEGQKTTYDDDTIIRMNILEEISVLNESIPANQLILTMDNSEGAFNLLTLDNMQKIIASKPKLEIELGLVYTPLNNTFEGFRYIRDWINGNSVNTTNYWNSIKCLAGTTDRCQGKLPTTNGTPTNFVNITDGNDTTYGYAWAQAGGVYAQVDLGAIYTDIDKIQVIHYYLDGRTFLDTKIEVSADGVTWTTLRDAAIHGTYPETSTGMSVFPPPTKTEWIPMGTFFLTEWKNEVTNKIITMIGHDYFALLRDTSFEPSPQTNLGALAREVLTTGGIAAEDQIIDSSLDTITINPVTERIDCRTLLQYIGIAAQAAVFQDRYGRINIKPFVAIDLSSNYISYPRTQNSIYGNYPSNTNYPMVGTGGGMKYLDFENLYDAPEVGLEKSIYQLVVTHKVGSTVYENVYINTAIGGTSGVSFKIDNPLINSIELADKVKDWFFRESNYNAIYRANWRANPILEPTDVILIEDSFGAEKQSRIFRQEFTYEGYLQGITESRGGI